MIQLFSVPQFPLVSLPRGGGELQAQASDLIWSQALGRNPYRQIPSAAAVNLPQNPTDLSDFKREDEGHPLSCDDREQPCSKPNWQESGQRQGASRHYVLENKAGHDQHLEEILVFNTGLGETEACIHTKTYTEGL